MVNMRAAIARGAYMGIQHSFKMQSRFVMRYIMRHIRRSAWKSALAALLAALLLCAIGQLALTRLSYTEVLENTRIYAKFVGGLPLRTAVQIANSALAADPYYEASATVEADFFEARLVLTNNIARYTGEETAIEYADGYDEFCMGSLGNIAIVGEGFLEAHGLVPGDSILISPQGLYRKLVKSYVDAHRRGDPGSAMTDAEILELNSVFFERELRQKSREFIVAGSFSTPTGAHDMDVMSPGIPYSVDFGVPDKVEKAEYTVADNGRIDEFREFCESVAGISGSATDSVRMFLDTSKIENIRNSIRLLESVYPMVTVAALLIGAFLCSLVIMQSSKEAAVMRALGTPKRMARTVLALEQMLLCAAGLVVGCGIMLAYKGRALAGVSAGILLFAALYFCAILISAAACSTLATRRSALELLQVKE